MSIFDLDTEGAKALAEEAQANPISTDEVRPGFFHGVFKATSMGVMRGGAKGADTLLTLTDSLDMRPVMDGYRGTNRIYPNAPKEFSAILSPEDVQARQRDLDEMRKRNIEYWTPNANEVGTAGRVLGGLSEIALPLMVTRGNPTLLVGSTAIQGRKDMLAQGVDENTATTVGLTEALATAAGFRLPFLGKTLASRVATGAAGNLLLGAGATEADRLILQVSGYDAQAEQFNPFDAEARIVDLLSGAAFGGIAHVTTPSVRDAALTGANAKHFQEDTAPGIAKDVTSSVLHQNAMEQAISDLSNGDPVHIDESITNAEFLRKRTKIAQAVHDVIREHIDVPEEAPARMSKLFPADQIERAPAEIRDTLRDVYQRAAEVKPKFDDAVRGIAKEIDTPHEPILKSSLKDVGRATEKILTDYAGDARRIKDVVRATIVVDSPAQAAQAIEAARQRFGEPTKLRNTLDESVKTTDGYRDVNMNVAVDGHIAELQVNVPEMVKAKKEMHSLYEERRALVSKSELSPADVARVNELNGAMKERYAAAWDSFLSRSKSASEISKPSSYAQESATGRPSGTSKASTLAPPPSVGKAATGTPPTSQKTLSRPITGIEPPGEIIPEIDAAGRFDIKTANDILAVKDLQIPTGEIDANGAPIVVSGRELMTRAKADVQTAKRESVMFETAVTCFLANGA